MSDISKILSQVQQPRRGRSQVDNDDRLNDERPEKGTDEYDTWYQGLSAEDQEVENELSGGMTRAPGPPVRKKAKPL